MSKTPTKSKLEIIRETVEAYAPDPKRLRSVKITNGRTGDSVCVYTPPDESDSPGCAVGRVLTRKGHDRMHQELKITGQDLISVDDVLKPAYHGHGTDFWADLQIIHDTSAHWMSDGLSVEGTQGVITMLVEWTDLTRQQAEVLSQNGDSWVWDVMSEDAREFSL